jgi:hypothetical protein
MTLPPAIIQLMNFTDFMILRKSAVLSKRRMGPSRFAENDEP